MEHLEPLPLTAFCALRFSARRARSYRRPTWLADVLLWHCSGWRIAALWRLWDVNRFAITAVDGRATVLIGDWRAGTVRLRSQEW